MHCWHPSPVQSQMRGSMNCRCTAAQGSSAWRSVPPLNAEWCSGAAPLKPTHWGLCLPSCPSGSGATRMGSAGLLNSLAPPAAAIGFGPCIVWRRGRSSSGAGRKYPGSRIHAWLSAESVSLWEGGRTMPNSTSHPGKLFCLQP